MVRKKITGYIFGNRLAVNYCVMHIYFCYSFILRLLTDPVRICILLYIHAYVHMLAILVKSGVYIYCSDFCKKWILLWVWKKYIYIILETFLCENYFKTCQYCCSWTCLNLAFFLIFVLTGCLMLIAWICLASIGIVAVRYYKTVWLEETCMRERIWYQVSHS